jgi:hypothetical protein
MKINNLSFLSFGDGLKAKKSTIKYYSNSCDRALNVNLQGKPVEYFGGD